MGWFETVVSIKWDGCLGLERFSNLNINRNIRARNWQQKKKNQNKNSWKTKKKNLGKNIPRNCSVERVTEKESQRNKKSEFRSPRSRQVYEKKILRFG